MLAMMIVDHHHRAIRRCRRGCTAANMVATVPKEVLERIVAFLVNDELAFIPGLTMIANSSRYMT